MTVLVICLLASIGLLLWLVRCLGDIRANSNRIANTLNSIEEMRRDEKFRQWGERQ